ncbi:MAG: Y-family DNA polymerase [Phycisphaerales bacterium JB050]
MPQPSPLNWLFIDMDGFFASAEQHFRPELRGKPVGVLPALTDRTCVIAANFQAKARGVKVGTPVGEAKRLCPGIALVKARPDLYVDLHHAVARSIDKCVPIHRAYSIDEWAARLTGPWRDINEAERLGRLVQQQVEADHSEWLKCSIGIAPTRLLAKIASDLEKPNGFVILTADALPDRLAHLEIEDLTGISKGVGSRLRARGISTIRDLWALSHTQAREAWGSVVGEQWWAGFHAHDEPEPVTRRRSMGHSNVLEPRFRSEEGARKMLMRLTMRLGLRLRMEGYSASRIAIAVRHAGDQPSFEADTGLNQVNDTPTLLKALFELWGRRPPHPPKPMGVGVTVYGLERIAQATPCLFTHHERDDKLSEALDTIQKRWGIGAAYYGAMHGCAHDMDQKIAFGRIPNLRKGQA